MEDEDRSSSSKSHQSSQYYAPVGGQRLVLEHVRGARCCSFVTLLCIFAAAIPTALFLAPEPYDTIIHSKVGNTWNHLEPTVIPDDGDTIDLFNREYSLTVVAENEQYEVEGMDANVEINIKLKGRNGDSGDWTKVYESTRTRTLTCDKGELKCRNITLLYDAAPMYEQFQAEVTIANDRKHAYGFVKRADYIFETFRAHWTFYEAALKLVLLVFGIRALYEFYDRISCGSPLKVCCGRQTRATALIQPDQRFVCLLLVGLICLNDFPLMLSILAGGWGAALLSDICAVSFAFIFLLVLCAMIVESYRPDRYRFAGYRRYMTLVFLIGTLWAVEVSWIIYVSAMSAENSSYQAEEDDSGLYIAVRSTILTGVTLILIGCSVSACYDAGVVDEKTEIFSQIQDTRWKLDRSRRSSFFWGLTFLWAFLMALTCLMIWVADNYDELPGQKTICDAREAVILTSVLLVTNAYIHALAWGFTPQRNRKHDEDIVEYLDKFRI